VESVEIVEIKRVSNFAFLKTEWAEIADTAQHAERYSQSDPRTTCFYARRALEQAVNWLYDHDPAFRRPYDDNLVALLTDYSFRSNVPPNIGNKAHFIRKMGNLAVHTDRRITPMDGLTVIKELYQLLYWLARTYTRNDPRAILSQFDEALLPPAEAQVKSQTAAQLTKLDEELKARDRELMEKAQMLADYQAQIDALQVQIAQAKEANSKIEVVHEYTEAETRKYLIDMLLREAGWDPKGENVEEYPVTGMPNRPGVGYVDYVLWGDDGLPLALVEAKRTSVDPKKGKQQAMLYADCLEAMHGQRPLIFYSNGYQTWLWDDANYPPRPVQGFYTKDEVELLVQRRDTGRNLAGVTINKTIVDRYYQEEAIRSLSEHLEKKYRKGLLVMATGTGKTRAAIALADLLMRANWVKRTLFLADRTALVRQAVNAFKRHLPESNPVNLLELYDKDEAKDSRVVVSTYHTMMGMIDEIKGNGERRFSVGHFDLVIIDEAHRSVYHKFGAIFDYFDSFLVGLTATPKDDVDRNTYHLFELEDGIPNYNYDLEHAVPDGYLTPPNPMSVPLKFQREGINYDDLTDEEKLEWELIDWDESGEIPEKIDPAALNTWLFNEDTVDKVLEHLMRYGLKVKGGDRLGKTIIFAKNHKHAEYIQERFDANYPHLAGHFARVIDNYQTYAQSLIDEFSKMEADPHLAISVDMLDTGIDIHEIVNLVFFKLVRSKTKFFQMLGRGTRLCPDLFGPGQDKEFFYVFDYCQNFEFFNQNPEGFESRPQEPLSQRVFKRRLELLDHYAKLKNSNAQVAELNEALAEELHQRVSAMPTDNFIVRPKRTYVDKYAKKQTWTSLSRTDLTDLAQHVSGLPTQLPEEDETALRFDLLILELQLALLERARRFERLREQVIELANQLESKTAIPMVNAQIAFIQEVQTASFWEGITLKMLEELRLNLRDLIKFIDKAGQKTIFTDFTDEIGEMKEAPAVYLTGGVNVAQYRKKVEQFIRAHQDQRVIRKIRFAMALNADDLAQLEEFLFKAGEIGTREDFERAYGERENLALFIRSLVGLDRKAAKQAFAEYLDEKTFTADQIRFVDYIIDHLTMNGMMDEALLYEQPYTDIHELGLDGVFPRVAGKLLEIIHGINQSAYYKEI
jgi:type I restriction enzyme R subunit